MSFEKNGLTISFSLLGLIGSPEGWGHACGASVVNVIQAHIEASPALIVRLSLQSVERIDASFAGELVSLAAHARTKRGFCLVDLASQDLLTNWHAAALCHSQPLSVWNDGTFFRCLGPMPSVGLREMLEYVQGRPVARTSDAATALHLNVPNASNKLKALWCAGYILRRELSAASGGVEYEYLRIA